MKIKRIKKVLAFVGIPLAGDITVRESVLFAATVVCGSFTTATFCWCWRFRVIYGARISSSETRHLCGRVCRKRISPRAGRLSLILKSCSGYFSLIQDVAQPHLLLYTHAIYSDAGVKRTNVGGEPSHCCSHLLAQAIYGIRRDKDSVAWRVEVRGCQGIYCFASLFLPPSSRFKFECSVALLLVFHCDFSDDHAR